MEEEGGRRKEEVKRSWKRSRPHLGVSSYFLNFLLPTYSFLLPSSSIY
jgi:hypothetical protein